MMGKYDGKGKKNGKGIHCRSYMDDYKIKDLHSLYEELKDDDDNHYSRDDDNDDGDWGDMEEKEPEEDNDGDNVVVNFTAVKLFGMPDEAFLDKETENKNYKEDKKSKGDGDYGDKNSGGGAKKGKKMRGGINRSASKGDN